MIKRILPLLIFLLGVGLFGDTVMIETIGDVPQGKRAFNQKELLIGMETGVMDALFDGGHLFFNINSSSGGLTGENTHKSLIQARNAGAQWLLRLIPGEEKIKYMIYDLSNLQLKSEDEIEKKDLSDTVDFKEFYFEAGKTAGQSIISIIGSTQETL